MEKQCSLWPFTPAMTDTSSKETHSEFVWPLVYGQVVSQTVKVSHQNYYIQKIPEPTTITKVVYLKVVAPKKQHG